METQQNEIKPPFKDQHLKPPGVEKKMDPRPEFIDKRYVGSSKLEGKKALITSGDSGIGRAVCAHFAREGADVAFTYLKSEKEDALETEDIIKSEGGKALAIEVDLTKSESVQKSVTKFVKVFGSLDVLVNNAAFQNHLESIEELDFSQFYKTFDTNIFAMFRLIKAALPHFNQPANIINTGSILGYVGDGSLIDYSATKGAIHTFTKSLAKELSKKKIRVNSVAPGPVWTPLNPAERKREEVKHFGEGTLFGRPAQPKEIAPAYVYLASEVTGSYVTGETINLFGEATGGN